MPSPETAKRPLEFETLDDVKREVRSLLESGYDAKGNWNLSQAVGHVEQWARFPMEGFPPIPFPMSAMMWVMKRTVGPMMKRKIFSEGMKSGVPAVPTTVPPADQLGDQQAAEALFATLDRLKHHDGPLIPSPFFGDLDHEQLQRLTCIHAAHHLAFLWPR